MNSLRALTLILVTTFVLGCATCPDKEYANDFSRMISANANSHEFPIRVENDICKDLDDKVGLCTKRIKRNQNLNINFFKLPYSYQLMIDCTNALDVDTEVTVLEQTEYTFLIPKEKYVGISNSFTCIFKIFPDDRAETVTSARVTIVLVDKNYSYREEMYKLKKYLIFGKYALHTVCYKDNKYNFYYKKTYIDYKTYDLCFSESYNGGINYYEFN